MILGLTGSIGGGKSTVREYLVSRQWVGFDADEYCKEIWRNPGKDFLRQIDAVFGSALYDKDGDLDKKKIADTVFSNPENMKKWQALLYPALEKEMRQIADTCRRNKQNAVFEVPLLFENSYEHFFDKVMTVWTSADIRTGRLTSRRQIDIEDIRRREKLQMSDEEKLEKADIGIINSFDRDFLIMQLDKFILSVE